MLDQMDAPSDPAGALLMLINCSNSSDRGAVQKPTFVCVAVGENNSTFSITSTQTASRHRTTPSLY